MHAEREREQFSQRLRLALEQAGWKSMGPAELAREFNARTSGNGVTLHAARKWLMGESIPTQDRLLVLSHWLGVSAEWLRFGEPPGAATPATPTPDDVGTQKVRPSAAMQRALFEDIKSLDGAQFRALREMVRLLLKPR